MTRYGYDPEVVETRWRFARAGYRYQWRNSAALYLTGAACMSMVEDWTRCAACGPVVRALREEERR